MVKYLPKDFKCNDCGREQYTNTYCRGCNGKSFSPLVNKEKEMQDLKQLLHNTIDVMTFEQLQQVHKSLNFSNEFNA